MHNKKPRDMVYELKTKSLIAQDKFQSKATDQRFYCCSSFQSHSEAVTRKQRLAPYFKFTTAPSTGLLSGILCQMLITQSNTQQINFWPQEYKHMYFISCLSTLRSFLLTDHDLPTFYCTERNKPLPMMEKFRCEMNISFILFDNFLLFS